MGISPAVALHGVNWSETLLWGEFWATASVTLGALLGKDCKILERCLIFWGSSLLSGHRGWQLEGCAMLSVTIEFLWSLFLTEEKHEMLENPVLRIFLLISDDRRSGVVDKLVKEGGAEAVTSSDGPESWWVMSDTTPACNSTLSCVLTLLLYKSVVTFVDFSLPQSFLGIEVVAWSA